MTLEESGASISLLSALPLAAPDLVQGGSSQPPPAICSAPEPLSPKSPDPNHTPNFPLLSCTPTLSPLSHAPKGHQANVTRAQKLKLEFRELGLLSKSGQPRTRAKGAQESCPVWVSNALLQLEGRMGRALGRAGRERRVALNGIRGPYWPLPIHHTPYRIPQRGIVMVLPSSMCMSHPAPPSVLRFKLPGEYLGCLYSVCHQFQAALTCSHGFFPGSLLSLWPGPCTF